MIRWKSENNHTIIYSMLNELLFTMGTITIYNNSPILEFIEPNENNEMPNERIWINSRSEVRICNKYNHQLNDYLTIEAVYKNVNINHPLVKYARESNFIIKPDEMHSYAKSMVFCLSHHETLRLLSENNYKLVPEDRLRKYIGTQYFALDWSQIDKSLRPPYYLWVQGRGRVEFTEDDFKKWRDS